MSNIVKITNILTVTHDVKSFRVEKPEGYQFSPGQATELSVNKPGMEEEKRPFTFTSLAGDDYLEFTIKRYPDHHGVTDLLHQLQVGDEVILRDVWGAIEYKGPGYFIAGGAGITPFLAILRNLHKEGKAAGNTLFFSNKTSADIIYEKELSAILGPGAVYILSQENNPVYLSGRIDAAFLRERVKDFGQHFYICGPDPMVAGIAALLEESGANTDAVVFEK